MINSNAHIISTIGWQTSIDSRENASGLMQRLSAWSKSEMPRCVSNTLDKLCPADQVWAIDTLELDLGAIEYNDLESALSSRITAQLVEKLTSVIFYAGRHDTNHIKITDQYTEEFNLLQTFLLSGLMPWNYGISNGCVNKLLASQLQHNRLNILMLVTQLGTNENVRKRIAWQFNSTAVHKIIAELEPVSHKEINRFSEELITLQRKENIVPSGSSGFKKNLLLWTLTYLLVERGTLFNRQAFIKSSIRQMADHYNIRQQDLLQLIATAVEKMEESNKVKFGLLKIIITIAKESSGIKKAEVNDTAGIEYWRKLGIHFQDRSHNRTANTKRELNALIQLAHREDPQRLLSLLQSLDQTDCWWSKLALDISIASLEIVVASLKPAESVVLMQVVDAFHLAAQSSMQCIHKKIFLEAGFQFLRSRQAVTSADRKAYVRHLIGFVSKIKGITESEACTLLAAGMPREFSKNVLAVAVYCELNEICRSSIKLCATALFDDKRDGLFDKLKTNSGGLPDSLKNILHQSLNADPAAFMQSLLSFPDKRVLEEQVLPELSIEQIIILLQQPGNEKGRSFFLFINQLKTIEKNRYNRILPLLVETLAALGLKYMLADPEVSVKKIIQRAVKELVFIFSAEQLAETTIALEAYHETEKPGLPDGAVNTTINIRSLKSRFSFQLPVFYRLMANAGSSKEKLLQWLYRNADDARLNELFTGNHESLRQLLDCIIKDGSSLMNVLVKEYCSLQTQPSEPAQKLTAAELRKLFLKVLANADSRHLSAEALSRAFSVAVAAGYPMPATAVDGNLHARKIPSSRLDRFVKLNEDVSIKAEELFGLIKSALCAGKDLLQYKGSMYECGYLISAGILHNPAQFRGLLLKSTKLQKTIATIKKGVSFSEFSLWITYDLQNEASTAMSELRVLHDLTLIVINEQLQEKLEYRFWYTAVEIIKEKVRPVSAVEKLVPIVFECFNLLSHVTPAYLQKKITQLGLQKDSVLLKAMHTISPSDSVLTQPQEIIRPAALEEAAHSGLLSELITEFISGMQVPFWYNPAASIPADELLKQLIEFYPYDTLLVLRKVKLSVRQIEWIHNKAGFTLFLSALKKVAREKEVQLHAFEAIYHAFSTISIQGITSQKLLAIFFQKILRAWQHNNWWILTPGAVLNELLWELTTVYGISKERFINDINKHRAMFPASLQTSIAVLKGNLDTVAGTKVNQGIFFKTGRHTDGSEKKALMAGGESIIVKNAGIVLLNNYIPLLLERLGLVVINKFVDAQAQADAVHYLQYLVTGLTQTEEFLLPLNKILCGLPLDTPVKKGIDISSEHRELMDGLIKAAINYWPVIGNTSANGFRGNWLVRDGQLKQTGEQWQLLVDKRSYDVLIGKLPFSFSVIKFPWMIQPLKVTWPY